MSRRPAIIAYDIREPKRRRQVHRRLQAWHLASQYSVFECLLETHEAEELLLQLTALIDAKTDKLLFAWLDNHRAAQALTRAAHIGFNKPVWYAG